MRKRICIDETRKTYLCKPKAPRLVTKSNLESENSSIHDVYR